MALTRNGVARGIDALGVNPANLGMRDRSSYSLSILPLGVRLSSDLLPYDIYQEYFTGIETADGIRRPKYLTDTDKNKIISSVREELGTARADFDVMLIGVSIDLPNIGGIGFSVSDHVGGTSVTPKDLFRFFLFGLDSAGSQYVFDGTSVSGWWWREFNFSYGMRVPVDFRFADNLFVGVGIKIIKGHGIMETLRYRASMNNTIVGSNQYRADLSLDYLIRRSGGDFLADRKRSGLSLFPDPAGSGVGLDLGVSADFSNIFVHVSLTNVGYISWKKNVVESYSVSSFSLEDPFSEANRDSLENAVRGYNRKGENFSTTLPSMLRVGLVVDPRSISYLNFLPGNMLLAFDYDQGLNNSVGNVTKPRFSVGVEYLPVSFLPLRTGLSAGGGEKLRWAAGFGLDFDSFSFDIATENLWGLFFPNDPGMISVAAGTKVRF